MTQNSLEKRNIGFLITSSGWGGLEMNTLKLADALSKLDYNITLFTQEQSTLLKNKKEQFADTVLMRRGPKYFDFRNASRLGDTLKRSRIGVLFVLDNKDLDLAAWAKRIFVKELCIIYQQHMQLGIAKRDVLHTFRFRAIDHWISPLESLKKEVIAKTRFPANRISVIPIGLKTDQFGPRKYAREEALRLLGITPTSPLIGIIGRISPKKGQRFVVESLIQLREMGLKYELLIFGSETVNDPECHEYYIQLKKLVADKNLNDIVHFSGFNEDIARFYCAIDTFVLASEKETYGMVTIEAMLSNVPVIATNSGGTVEILGHGKYGLLYEPENQRDFCDKVIGQSQHPNETREMTELAFVESKSKYELSVEVEAIHRLLQGTAR